MSNLLSNVKVIRCVGYNAASTTNRKGTIIDMEGFESVTFIAQFGTMLNASKIELVAGQHEENDTSKMVESEATTGEVLSDGTDDVHLILDVVKPAKRYIEPHIKISDQNALVEGCIAILHGPRTAPVEQDDAVLAAKTFQSPGAA